MTAKKKLIEVALPRDAINKAAAREKSIRHGHPSTLHLWWARRPLAAARAVLFAQLVDNPSAHPDLFKKPKAQEKERQRLFRILEDLVLWLTAKGKKCIAQINAEGMETARKSWAFYPEGGIEVKTTCGSVPTATKTRKKPQIGDQPTLLLTGVDWKARHRETNRLLGLFWDFINKIPTVLALFYRNDLAEADWGEVVVPLKEDAVDSVDRVEEGMDGDLVVEMTLDAAAQAAIPKKKPGRTTSVSIMTTAAVKKLGKGWVVQPSDPELLAALGKKSIFDLGLPDVEPLTTNLPQVARETLATLQQERQRQLEKQAASPKPPAKEGAKKRAPRKN